MADRPAVVICGITPLPFVAVEIAGRQFCSEGMSPIDAHDLAEAANRVLAKMATAQEAKKAEVSAA